MCVCGDLVEGMESILTHMQDDPQVVRQREYSEQLRSMMEAKQQQRRRERERDKETDRQVPHT